MQNFCDKAAKIHKKKLNFENTSSFAKSDLSTSPNDGLTQNINIDLRTSRRHQKFIDLLENTFSNINIFLLKHKIVWKLKMLFIKHLLKYRKRNYFYGIIKLQILSYQSIRIPQGLLSN